LRGRGQTKSGQENFASPKQAKQTILPRGSRRSKARQCLKYVPRTGEWGEAEVCQVTFTPVETPNLTVEWHKVATGTIAFRRATWAELPTKHHVVNALANLPVVETPAALVAHSRGGKSYVDTRILK